MAKIIAIANQKGGVAKTTTATALAGGLNLRRYKALLIDTDPQCNSSDTYRAKIEGTPTLYDLLYNGEPVEETIQKTAAGDIIPSDTQLISAENLLTRVGKEYILKKAVSPIAGEYDYIIIDTPPSLGVLLINALTFADTVIIPVTADRYSLQGLAQIRSTIKTAQEYTNPGLTIAGLLLTKFNSRTNLSRDVLSTIVDIASQLDTIIFDTKIRESVSAKEAQALRKSIYAHSPKSTTATDYLNFIYELIKRGV